LARGKYHFDLFNASIVAEIDLSKLGDALDTFLGEGGNDDLLNQIIENWWNQRVYPEIARSMDEKKINASSALKQSFVPGEIVKSPTSINTILLAEDYWEFVEYGRKPTRGTVTLKALRICGSPSKNGSPTKESSQQTQNMTYDSLAKAIAKKIHRRGTKANPFLSDAFTESLQMELVNELNARLGDLIFAVEVKS
jgi:hypothetical protein